MRALLFLTLVATVCGAQTNEVESLFQRELFGFDRARDISGKSAQEIADAAKAWGQNDDITVVTVRRIA